jgi:hypothetical protein
MIDANNDLRTAGYKYSSLTGEELKTIRNAEQTLSKSRNSSQILLAYDQAGGAGQS